MAKRQKQHERQSPWTRQPVAIKLVSEFLDQTDIFTRCHLVCQTWRLHSPLVNWKIAKFAHFPDITYMFRKFIKGDCPQKLSHLVCTPETLSRDELRFLHRSIAQCALRTLNAFFLKTDLQVETDLDELLQDLNSCENLKWLALRLDKSPALYKRGTVYVTKPALCFQSLIYLELYTWARLNLDLHELTPNLQTLLLDAENVTLRSLPYKTLVTLCCTAPRTQMAELMKHWCRCEALMNLSCFIRYKYGWPVAHWVFPECLQALELLDFDFISVKQVQRLPHLNSLRLRECTSPEDGEVRLFHADNLKEFKCSCTSLGAFAVADIISTSAATLERLDLIPVHLTQLEADSIGMCARLKKCNIEQVALKRTHRALVLSFSESLEVLNLAWSRFDGSNAEALARSCPRLKHISLRFITSDLRREMKKFFPKVKRNYDWRQKAQIEFDPVFYQRPSAFWD
jgi:hypothetical protein